MKSASFDAYCCQFYEKKADTSVSWDNFLVEQSSGKTMSFAPNLSCVVSLAKHLEFEFEVFAYFARQFLCRRYEQIKHVRCCVRRCADVW